MDELSPRQVACRDISSTILQKFTAEPRVARSTRRPTTKSGPAIRASIVPQTIQQHYWLTDLDVTPIGKTDKQIYWALMYDSRTDQELLDKIRGRLKGLKDSPARR